MTYAWHQLLIFRKLHTHGRKPNSLAISKLSKDSEALQWRNRKWERIFCKRITSEMCLRAIIRQRPHYTIKIWTSSFLLRLGRWSTIIRQENRAFRKRFSLKRRSQVWKRRLCVFLSTEHNLKTELFQSDGVTKIMWFTCPRVLLKQKWKLKMTDDCYVFNFPGCSVDRRKTINAILEWNLHFQIPTV